jgi:hypothetical protein
MEARSAIDRRKQEIDVLEQVMKGVRTQGPERGHAPQMVAIRRAADGTVRCSVQVQVLVDDPDER